MTVTKPNILFILTDDQRFDTIAALGHPEIQTPSLDQVVAEGVAFTNAYIMGGTRPAVCMPSRAMIHTGRMLDRIADDGQRIDQNHALLAEHFRRAGYQTFGTGKWHNGTESYARSFTTGDEIFFGGMADHWNVPAFHYDPNGRYDITLLECKSPANSNQLGFRRADHIHAGRHSTDIIAQAACRFIDDHDRTKPFFAYVSFLAPHDPRTMPIEFLNRYHPEKIVLPPNFLTEHPFNNGWLSVRDEQLASFPRNPTEIRRHIAEYYAMITHVDDRIGQIMTRLKMRGLYENTIIVMTGDNGLALGQHGLMGKQNCYEHSLHVPLLMAGPGIPKNERRGNLCYLLDLFPTLCDLANIDTPMTVDGRSLWPAINEPTRHTRDFLYFFFMNTHRAIRDNRWKLIMTCVDNQKWIQLFDLDNDPWEMTNLAEQTSASEELQRLGYLLEAQSSKPIAKLPFTSCYDYSQPESRSVHLSESDYGTTVTRSDDTP